MTLYDFYVGMDENITILENAEDYFQIKAVAAYICGDVCFLERSIQNEIIIFETEEMKNEATRLAIRLSSACLVTLQYYGKKIFRCVPLIIQRSKDLILFLEKNAEE